MLRPTNSSLPRKNSAPSIYEKIKRPSDAYAVLSSVIESAQNDRATLRRFVYDVAWKMFAREAEQRGKPFTSTELLTGARALAEAIEQIEVESSQESKANDVRRIGHKPTGHENSVIIYEPAKASASDKVVPTVLVQSRPGLSDRYSAEKSPHKILNQPRRIWLWYFLWPFLQLMAGIVLAVGFVTVIRSDLKDEMTQFFEKPNTNHITRRLDAKQTLSKPGDDATLAKIDIEKSSREMSPQSQALAPGLPLLPTTYGVYAVNRGTLHTLEPLPIRVPDARILLSAEIDKPSQTILPDGKVEFIVFRRELENRAPDKLSIRVVAHVARSISYRSGNAVVTDLGDVWRIRAKSYSFSVSPVPGNREIVVARPEATDFSLPAGRYALVFNNAGYDFSIAGKVTVADQCIESTETTNGTIYSECRNP